MSLLVSGWDGDRSFFVNGVVDAVYRSGINGALNRAPAIGRPAQFGRSMAHSWWVGEMAIGRLVKTRRSMRYTPGIAGRPKSRIRHRRRRPRRLVDGALLAGGWNGNRSLRTRGRRCGIPTGGRHAAPRFAHPPPTRSQGPCDPRWVYRTNLPILRNGRSPFHHRI